MRTAVISDVHANLQALDAVCRQADALHVGAWVCLGDVVGYGADPEPCLARVRDLTGVVVQGNHDAAAAGLLSSARFNVLARRAVRWTTAQFNADDLDWLHDLPLVREHRGALLVHADPCLPGAWGYVLSRLEAADALQATVAPLSFIGHSHQPFACATPEGIAAAAATLQWLAAGPQAVALEQSRRYLVNVGSVGQPRDGDPRAGFVIWDDDRACIEFVRTPYDVSTAQSRIVAAGLPAFLAQRLSSGV